MTHPEPRVVAALNERVVPYKASLFERNPHFKEIVGRTPTPYAPAFLALGVSSSGKVREIHRRIGWLGPDDTLAEIGLIEGLDAIQTNRFEHAVERLGTTLEEFPDSQIAPELLYWKGVARFRVGDRDLRALAEDHETLIERYPDSIWARRAAPIQDR